jgi:glycine/D-amino acid oxidase-like deaminating enzyme
MASVAVIGAGFVGLSTAYWLMRDGHQVTLFEPIGAGGGASFGNAGTFANYACIPINNPSVFRDLPRFMFSRESPFQLRWSYLPYLTPWLLHFLINSGERRYTASATALAVMLGRAYDGYREMLEHANLEKFIHRRECLYLYSSAKTFESSASTLELRRSLGVDFQVYNSAEVRQLEPQLDSIFDRGVMFNGSWFLSDPSLFLNSLQEWLIESGMQVQRCAVNELKPQANGVLLKTTTGDVGSDFVAVCAGAFSQPFASQCGDHLPLETERGYHITYPGTSGLISRPIGWAERGLYMTPMEQGIRVAGTVELGGMGPIKNDRLLRLLQYSSKRALPALTTPSESWLGFRPSMPDGLPVIGRSRDSKRVIYAFGHQHIGLTLGGLSGAIVANLIGERDCGFDLRPYAPDRFR